MKRGNWAEGCPGQVSRQTLVGLPTPAAEHLGWTRCWYLALLILLLTPVACGSPAPGSRHSFSEIEELVHGKSAAEVQQLLGEPDTKQSVFLADERWIWWNFTYLAGDRYPPEERGRIVHLTITFRNPVGPGLSRRPYSEWWIDDPFGVAFRPPAGQGRN